jgi:hypothetical protein
VGVQVPEGFAGDPMIAVIYARKSTEENIASAECRQ